MNMDYDELAKENNCIILHVFFKLNYFITTEGNYLRHVSVKSKSVLC